ncbi:MAG TPA: hypothetical protein VHG91_21325 [Longimicrobium sp.]|nr:hypothetical protein [Longimicrobium sp.]
MSNSKIFLLSPAFCGGKRGRLVLRDEASFELAKRLRTEEGAPLGEVFAFLSGLYFRGKMRYVERFADPPPGLPGALVITPTRGLVPPEAPVRLGLIREFADEGNVDLKNPAYSGPLETHARALDEATGGACDMVLLGSIATGKYVDLLLRVFGERLLFPIDFVGRGDMSRGGLMLRAAASGEELTYAPVAGAARHGRRPPKLEPRRWPKDG